MEIEMDREAAMARIRAEIMASDWRLNRRRAEGLRVALAAVESAADGSKAFRYLLEMTLVALAYQEKRGEEAPPMVLDFLKQALAQVVTFIEEEQLPAERGTEIFNKVHLSFINLKRQLALTQLGKVR